MLKSSISFISVLLLVIPISAQTTFQKAIGGAIDEDAYFVQQTSDDGYVMTGRTNSFGAGEFDVYVVKTDANGDTMWTKTFGTAEGDNGNCILQTSDGGYIVTGSIYHLGQSFSDVYLIKLNASGDSLWTKSIQVKDFETGNYIQQTSDGGYIIVGETSVFNDFIIDVCLIKTDANGDTLWTKVFGGINNDYGYCVQQTNDGGYIIAGKTESFGNGVSDMYVIKTDSNGDSLWIKTFGGANSEDAKSILQTSNNGYVILGTTSSFNAGGSDVYLVKLNSSGDTLWTKVIGGALSDQGNSMNQTSDGGFIIGGTTYSFGFGAEDAYLIKTDSSGNILWQKSIGGSNSDWGLSVQQTSDSGYVIAGGTRSFGSGGFNVYLVKTDVNGNFTGINVPFENANFLISPNPSDGKFKIQNEKGKIQSVEIYNVLGEKVYEMENGRCLMENGKNTLTINPFPLTIDISNQPQGIYFVKLQTQEGVQVQKVIVQ